MANISALLEDPKILEAALNGDEKLHNQLYKEIEGFIHHQKHIWVAKLFNGDPNMNDEVLGEINLAYLLSLKKYDRLRGSFINFFAYCLNNHMLMYYRKHLQKLKGIAIVSLDYEFNQEDGSSIVNHDLIPAIEEDKLENIISQELCAEIINNELPYSNHGNLILLKIKGLNQVQISERLNLSQAYVSKILKKQINELSRVLRNKEIYFDDSCPIDNSQKHIPKVEEKQIQEIIRLREEFNLSYSQIGEIYGLHKDAVCSRIRRYKGELDSWEQK